MNINTAHQIARAAFNKGQELVTSPAVMADVDSHHDDAIYWIAGTGDAQIDAQILALFEAAAMEINDEFCTAKRREDDEGVTIELTVCNLNVD